MNKSTIIGISGISGAGKTTLVKALATQLQSSALYWDDFNEKSKLPEDNNEAWFEPSKQYAECETLAEALFQLKNGNTVMHPVSKDKIIATEYIIVVAPWGKTHKQTAQFIDYFIHIDVPLDIAFARRIIRDAKEAAYTKQDILSGLQHYLAKSRKFFSEARMCEISNSADCHVDGADDIQIQVDKVMLFLKQPKIFTSHTIKINIVDKVDDETEEKMRKSFAAYEADHNINVNYKSFALIMTKNNTVIGVLSAYTAFAEIYVNDLWVDAAFRGKGYGRRLMLELEQRFKGKGFNNINLVTSAFQAPEFYKKCGYKVEFQRYNEKNPELTKTFFVKFFAEEHQSQGIINKMIDKNP